MNKFKVGDEAPDFSLPSIEGNVTSLSSLCLPNAEEKEPRKKAALLIFVTGKLDTYKELADDIMKIHEKVKSNMAEAVIICSQPKEAITEFVERNGITCLVLMDENKNVTKRYCRFSRLPFHYASLAVVDSTLHIQYYREHVYMEKHAETYVEDAFEALSQLQTEKKEESEEGKEEEKGKESKKKEKEKEKKMKKETKKKEKEKKKEKNKKEEKKSEEKAEEPKEEKKTETETPHEMKEKVQPTETTGPRLAVAEQE